MLRDVETSNCRAKGSYCRAKGSWLTIEACIVFCYAIRHVGSWVRYVCPLKPVNYYKMLCPTLFGGLKRHAGLLTIPTSHFDIHHIDLMHRAWTFDGLIDLG